MKKWLSLILVLALTLSPAGCGLQGGDVSGEAVSEDGEGDLNEKLKISWIGHATYDPIIDNGTPMQKLVEEKFNVELEIVPLYNQDAERWNLFWASGNTADHISLDHGRENLIDQAIVRPIERETMEANMPTWLSKVAELVGSEEMMWEQVVYNDGQIYQVPFSHAPVMETGVMFIREDWLNNLGLSIPTTLDEFHDILTAFTKDDPDGNGADDTYGINGFGRYHFNYVFGAYGFMPKTYQRDEAGKVTYSSVEEPYKETLKILQSWYNEGLIDPETFTDDRTRQREKWADGQFGILSDNPFWASSSRGATGIREMVLTKNSEAQVTPFEAVTGPDGARGSYLDYPICVAQGAILFGADTSDEKVERIMQIREAFAADFDLYVRGYYGEEGKHWERSPEGKIVVLSTVTPETYKTEGIAQFFALQPLTFAEQDNFITTADMPTHSISSSQPAIYTGADFYAPRKNESQAIRGEDFGRIVDEYYANAITGKVDIDATWDSYVQSVYDAGLSEVLTEYEGMFS